MKNTFFQYFDLFLLNVIGIRISHMFSDKHQTIRRRTIRRRTICRVLFVGIYSLQRISFVHLNEKNFHTFLLISCFYRYW